MDGSLGTKHSSGRDISTSPIACNVCNVQLVPPGCWGAIQYFVMVQLGVRGLVGMGVWGSDKRL